MRNGRQTQTIIRGANCAIGAQETTDASIHIVNGRIAHLLRDTSPPPGATLDCLEIDLSGYLVLPGLINAHDHLEFSLFPRLANPPYRNYIDWGNDIHDTFPDLIAKYRAVPKKLRLWWGGIRNLLCGATTVGHHNPLFPELQREDFPVRVIQKYGWGHSVALGGDLCAARSITPKDSAFVVHACEGVDDRAREELWELDRLGLLDANTVLVHGLAIDQEGVALMCQRQTSLIVCPSSNRFLFGKLPDMSLLGKIGNVALGNDSPLTAVGDLLDEIRFAVKFCKTSPLTAYYMVTRAPATILRLTDMEGTITESGTADLIAVRDTGESPADTLQTLSMNDIEFVMIGGRVHLASEEIFKRLSFSIKQGLEPLSVEGTVRWLRTPIRELLRKTEEILGTGEVRLGSRSVGIPVYAEA